jgi:hypothetical protein
MMLVQIVLRQTITNEYSKTLSTVYKNQNIFISFGNIITNFWELLPWQKASMRNSKNIEEN